MADLIAIAGESGSGKTTSVKYLNPKETLVISILGKPLPFAGFKKNYTPLRKDESGNWIGNFYKTKDTSKILSVFQIINKSRKDIKYIVIDDANYLLSCETMDKAEEKGYEKFTLLAKHYYDVIMAATELREDLMVFFITHTENVGDVITPKHKIKTTGKMLDSVVNVDGLFTYVIYCELMEAADDTMSRTFRTNTLKGEDTCKTPHNCFKDLYIDNNLQIVADTINKYNNGEEE